MQTALSDGLPSDHNFRHDILVEVLGILAALDCSEAGEAEVERYDRAVAHAVAHAPPTGGQTFRLRDVLEIV